jgi:hypothetical protein
MWSFLVFGRLSLCFSGWVGLVSGILCGGEEGYFKAWKVDFAACACGGQPQEPHFVQFNP